MQCHLLSSNAHCRLGVPLHRSTPGPGRMQRPEGSGPQGSSKEWADIITPIHKNFWEHELTTYPDKKFASWIVGGINRGFRIGFSSNGLVLQSAKCNMISAGEHPQVILNYIRDEVTSQDLQLVGPAWSPKLPQVHLSPLGVIPKKGRPNCWQLIMDLLSPHGHSINDDVGHGQFGCAAVEGTREGND